MFWGGTLTLGVLGMFQTHLMLTTKVADVDIETYNQTGELKVAWVDYYSNGWKLIQVLWLIVTLGSMSNLLYKWLYVIRLNEQDYQASEQDSIFEIAPVSSVLESCDNSSIQLTKEAPINLIQSPANSFNSVSNPVHNTIQDSERDVVYELMNDPCLMFLSPEKGSGKTSRAAANIANHLKAGHLCKAILPVGSNHEYKGLFVYGRKSTDEEKWQDIELGIYEFIQEAKRRDTLNSSPDYPDYSPFDEQHIHLFCDEMSGFDQKIDPNLIIELWDVNIRLLRQVNMSFGLAAHGFEKVHLGGEKALSGKIGTILAGSTQLLLEGIKDNSVAGNYKPGEWFTKIPTGISPYKPDHPKIQRLRFPSGYFAPSGYYQTPTGRKVRYSDFTSLITQENKSPDKLEQDLLPINSSAYEYYAFN